MINCGTFSKEIEFFVKGTPLFVRYGQGAKLHLSDGRAYIDTVMGLGAYPRGYSTTIAREVAASLNGGLTYTLPSELWPRAKDLICRVLNIEDCRPVRTGSDGCMAAVMLARAVRPGKIIVHKDNYHGQWVQWKLPARGSLIDLSEFIVVDHQDPRTWPPSANGISCILYELPLDEPSDWWSEYILDMREEGVLFLADEVVTALRYPGNRAFPVADLIIAGKGLSNGFGMYVIGGSQELLEEFKPENPVFVSTTYAADVAACAGTITNLSDSNINQMGENLTKIGLALWDKLNKKFFSEDSHIRIVGHPSRFVFQADPEIWAGFREFCLEKGMIVNRPFFISFAHAGLLDRIANILNVAYLEKRKSKPTMKLFGGR